VMPFAVEICLKRYLRTFNLLIITVNNLEVLFMKLFLFGLVSVGALMNVAVFANDTAAVPSLEDRVKDLEDRVSNLESAWPIAPMPKSYTCVAECSLLHRPRYYGENRVAAAFSVKASAQTAAAAELKVREQCYKEPGISHQINGLSCAGDDASAPSKPSAPVSGKTDWSNIEEETENMSVWGR
jgi:hypothetical protein